MIQSSIKDVASKSQVRRGTKKDMIFLDSESCGLHGMCVLIQWAHNDDDTQLFSPWTEPVFETLRLIETFCEDEDGVVGFNLTFDWFHLTKLYCVFKLFAERHGYDKVPLHHIEDIAELEHDAHDVCCVKPKSAHDIMLHARKGPYQSTMDRSDIRIKRVPVMLAFPLSKELNKRIKLNDVYFARRKNKYEAQWKVLETKDEDVNFRDVVLKFAPSSALKALSLDALKLEEDSILLFTDIEVPHHLRPVEKGWAPFAKSVGSASNWRGAWPDVIRFHISHWAYNDLARKYALDDVQRYTRPLYKYFGSPPLGDNDSILACAIGAIRWRGFRVDLAGIKMLRKSALAKSKNAPKAPNAVRKWLHEVMSDEEKIVLTSTSKVVLEEVAKFKEFDADGNETKELTQAAERAKSVLESRTAQKEVELYNKLIEAGRFHASFKIIGTLSGRMAGGDGLNPQGIKREKWVRSKFPLAPGGMELTGGDFSGFEVCIADAAYGDPDLRKDLQTKVKCIDCDGSGVKKEKQCKDCDGTGMSGMKIHALLGEALFPEETYDSIIASKGTDHDFYDKAKRGTFGILYGGDENTLKNRVGIDIEDAMRGYKRFITRYKKVGEARLKVFDSFCSMRQDGGIGSIVEWHEPDDYIESLLGYKRYFTLENKICKTLFDLAQNQPAEWKGIKIKVMRRERVQTAGGATMSSLFGAAFGIQAANMRAAANHVIQSTGAEITKDLQVMLWELQPVGIQDWHIMVMNVHDEVMAPAKRELKSKISDVVGSLIEKYKKLVPLIKIDWNNNLKSWADK